MAGSIATLAVLWISLQGMGFVVQPSALDASRVPISLQNYLSSYTGLPSLAYQPGELTVSTRSLLDRQIFPAVDEKAINSSVNFAHMIINRLARLEASIASAGVAFTNDTPTHGQYIDWYPIPTAHKKSIHALVGVKASAFLAQSNCHRYGLKRKSCAQFVSSLKMDGTDIGQKCAKDQELDCDSNSHYRTIDGTCNNLDNPRWGSALTAYSRILFPNYADGIQEIRRPEKRGKRLPSPRAVSLAVSMNDIQEIDSTKTLAVMQWAQFISHDVSHTPVRKMVTNDQPISCCRPNGYFLLPRYTHPDCAAISIPDDDPIYGEERIRCMNYVRSMPAVRQDCSFGPVEQMNQVSHYLDGSTIYGSTLKTSRMLRTFANGFLRVEVRNRNEYLPTAILRPASLCNDNGCYMAGDFRVNFVPHLAVMHTIWHREHNRVAAQLARLNPLWTDEILYQEARRIVIAEIQHITYREWLPLILGTNNTSYGHVFPVNGNGSSQAYNNLDNPSISNEAATAAFRFMNSLVQGQLHVYNESRLVTASLKLHEHFNKAKVLEDAEVLDGLIRGLSTQLAQKMDSHIVSDMTNKMYKTIGKLGLDSISLDIQRGRDHGLPGYNEYRKFCGLPFAENFDDLLDTIPIETVNKLNMVYNHPNDIDLVVGGMAERPNAGGLLGPTFSCIISEQFARMRRTDRFFYDSTSQPHPFTEDQLNALRNVSLARIFCDNGDTVASMQPHVFLKPQPGNELGPCDDYEAIPSVDLFAWAEKAKAYR